MLLKGRLIVLDRGGGNAEDIEFMFNPQEISFSRESQWQSDVGVRTTGSTGSNANEEGPKINFGGVQAYTFSLNKLIFDTYETKESVLYKYIDNIKKGVATPRGLNTRPPVYALVWGNYDYFPCVMTSLTYTFTMFMNDGTPVRTLVDISLLEVDKGALTKKAAKEWKEEQDDLDDRREDANEEREKQNRNAERERQLQEEQRIETEKRAQEEQRIANERQAQEEQKIKERRAQEEQRKEQERRAQEEQNN
jgi:flagellar biosynthesis GTPase FlhF